MPSMFPTPATGGDDANRRPRNTGDGVGMPTALKWSFGIYLGTAALMLLTAMVMFTAGYTGPTEDVDTEYMELVVSNQKFIGAINGLAAVVIAALISQVARSGKNLRRLLLVISFLVILVDLLSFVTRAGGPSLAAIAILLAFATLLVFRPSVGDLVEVIRDEPLDRAILDMLAPWECIDAVGERLIPGGVLCCYVATATQLGRVADTLRAHGGFTEPHLTETTVRDWHAEGLAIRPGHATTSHTGFLVWSRRLAPGVVAPMRKRRPAPGAYGPDYTGPRPASES